MINCIKLQERSRKSTVIYRQTKKNEALPMEASFQTIIKSKPKHLKNIIQASIWLILEKVLTEIFILKNIYFIYFILPYLRPMLPSYRNQLNNLHCISNKWFLFDGSIGSQYFKSCLLNVTGIFTWLKQISSAWKVEIFRMEGKNWSGIVLIHYLLLTIFIKSRSTVKLLFVS